MERIRMAALSVLVFCGLAGVSPDGQADSLSDRHVIQTLRNQAADSVGLVLGSYEIHTPDGKVFLSGAYSGSAFLMEDGWIASNRHVLAPWNESFDQTQLIAAGGVVVWTEYCVVLANQIHALDASTLRVSEDHDCAVVKIKGETTAKPLEVREDGSEGSGVNAYVMGYPLGLKPLMARAPAHVKEHITFWADRMTIISTLCKYGYVRPLLTAGVIGLDQGNYIITDAGLYFGNSGGPVFGDDGKVIGLATALMDEAYNGHNFVTPISHVLALLD